MWHSTAAVILIGVRGEIIGRLLGYLPVEDDAASPGIVIWALPVFRLLLTLGALASGRRLAGAGRDVPDDG
jgi:hypothetical protein